MRILYHHRTRGGDAQGIHINALCRSLEAVGHEVCLMGPAQPAVTGKSDGAGTQPSEQKSPRALTIPGWLYETAALLYNLPALFALLIKGFRWRADAIYERYAVYNTAGLMAARILRIPLILEVNAPLSEEMQRDGRLHWPRLATAMENSLIRRADAVIVVTRVLQGIFEKRGVTARQWLVMHNGIDRERFHRQVDGQHRRETMQATADDVVAGFVGWIRPWHGVDQAIYALQALRDEVPSLKLLLVGDGPALPELRQLVAHLGLDDRVHFTGAVNREEIPSWLAAMDLGLQPDVTPYASPIKLFEYLAMGLPVIAPERENIQEVMRHRQEGLLLPDGDVGALARALLALSTDPALRSTLGRQAHDRIEQGGFLWQENARRVISFLNTYSTRTG
ncbi:MAG: glycosyltransferase family 4 protein [Magnetococcales bacterium]|nr:glycosyltransferase family 4 protein [Magnetococcales bacterium]